MRTFRLTLPGALLLTATACGSDNDTSETTTAPNWLRVESDRAKLGEVVQRVRDGRLRTNIGNVASLDDAVAVLNRTERRKGKTIIHVRP
jgi:NADPH:quinone reductase-like Zn-dependent oxidoreductase